jgi:hypothetical protein
MPDNNSRTANSLQSEIGHLVSDVFLRLKKAASARSAPKKYPKFIRRRKAPLFILKKRFFWKLSHKNDLIGI